MASTLRRLPLDNDVWHVVIVQLPALVTVTPESAAVQPWLIMVFDADAFLVYQASAEPEAPNAKRLLDVLQKAMQEPLAGAEPHRPRMVQFEQKRWVDALRKDLAALYIGVETAERPESAQLLVDSFLKQMAGEGPTAVSLMEIDGITPELLGGFFAAAAEFYEAEPWDLFGEELLGVHVFPDRQRFAIVMGGGGMEYGLAAFRQLEDYLLQFEEVDNPLEAVPATGAEGLTFGPPSELALADVEAIEQYGWPVAGPEAYPCPINIDRSGQSHALTVTDLRWYEAAMRALTQLSQAHPDLDLPDEADETFEVAVHAGTRKVQITYPIAELDQYDLSSEPSSWMEEIVADPEVLEAARALFGDDFDPEDLDEEYEEDEYDDLLLGIGDPDLERAA